MYNYTEKLTYNNYSIEVEIFYIFNQSGDPIYTHHAFFVLQDKKVLEDFPEEIINFVQEFVNDILLNKIYKLAINA